MVDGAVPLIPRQVLALRDIGCAGHIPEVVLQEPQQLVAYLVVVARVDGRGDINVAHPEGRAPQPHLPRWRVAIWKRLTVGLGHRRGYPGQREAGRQRGQRRHHAARAAPGRELAVRVTVELDGTAIAGHDDLAPADEGGNLIQRRGLLWAGGHAHCSRDESCDTCARLMRMARASRSVADCIQYRRNRRGSCWRWCGHDRAARSRCGAGASARRRSSSYATHPTHPTATRYWATRRIRADAYRPVPHRAGESARSHPTLRQVSLAVV